MEGRLETCLRSAKIGSNSNENPKKFIDDLACILIDNCGTEIDAAIQRFLLRSRSMSLTSSGIQVQTPRINNDSNFMQYRLRSITDAIIFEPGFKAIRSRFFKVCHRFRPPISRSSSSDMRYMSTNSSANSDETILALSAFSFGYSLRSMAGGDLNRHINLIIDSNFDLKQRLNSLEILTTISPLMLIRNADLSLFIENLDNLLCESQLFVGIMQLLNRLLLMKDEKFWIKIIHKLAKNAEILLKKDDLMNVIKIQFVDFFLQLIGDNSGMYRHFTLNSQLEIMHSFTLVLKPNSKFILFSSLLNPTLTWLRPRLDNHSQRSIIGSALESIINNYLFDEMPTHQKVQCFRFCLLIQCIKYVDLLCKLDILTVTEFIKRTINLVLRRKKFKKTCTILLLEASMNQTSASFFTTHLIPTFSSLKQPLAAKLIANCLKYSPTYQNPKTLHDLINNGINSQNATTFQLTLEILEILHSKKCLSSILANLDLPKLTSRLDPKSSNQHTNLILAIGMTKNSAIWNHSFKNFIKSPDLNLIEHILNFENLEQKHTISRFLIKFLTFGEEKIGDFDYKWESSSLLWMILSQPYLLDQLINSIHLNSIINEQFRKIGQNQQAEFFRRLSMLLTNLDTLVMVRKHFQISTKLAHILQISSENKIIVDERLETLHPLLKQWYICGPNEFDMELKKISDLRLIVNGNFVCKRDYTDLKFPSILQIYPNNPSEWLQNYLESDCQLEHLECVEKLIEIMGNVDLEMNTTKLEKNEFLSTIVDYGHSLGLVHNKKSTISKLTNLTLPQKINKWFLASSLLSTKFDINLTSKLLFSNIPFIGSQPKEFFNYIEIELLPKVKKLLKVLFSSMLPRIQNLPIFHLLSHYTYRNYIGLLNYDQLMEYFVLQLCLGANFRALFFVLVLEHICKEFSNSTTPIPLRHFFLPKLGNNFSLKYALTVHKIARFGELFDDDKE